MGLARSQAGEITAVLCRLAQDLTSGLELKALGTPSFHKLGTLGLSTQLERCVGLLCPFLPLLFALPITCTLAKCSWRQFPEQDPETP